MKQNRIIYERWLRTMFLSFALLMAGGKVAWGQTGTTRPSIQLIEGNKHDSVFVDTKVIYVVPGKERELFIPELRISYSIVPNNDRYNWYVHWYVKNSNEANKGTVAFKQVVVDYDVAMNQGGDLPAGRTTKNYFVTVSNGDGGLVWSKRLKEHFNDPDGYGIDASTISYTAKSGYQEGDTVYCDVSIYRDGSINSGGAYIEPSLTKRTKYIIKNADEYINNNKIEEFYFDYPAERHAVNFDGRKDDKNKSLNFSMPSMANNYFWKAEDGKIIQGSKFQYKVGDGAYKNFSLVTRPNIDLPYQQTQRIPLTDYPNEGEDIIIFVRAVDESGSYQSKELAKFIFHPLQGVGFELEKNLTGNNRYPRRDTSRYQLIGNVSFDLGDPISYDNLTEKNNIASDPFGSFKKNQTTYGFFDTEISPLLRTQWGGGTPYYVSTSNQNIYGLFRTANDPKSKDGKYVPMSANGDNWQFCYLWVPARSSGKDNVNYKDSIMYDRTYYISKDKNEPVNADKTEEELNNNIKYGHFFYVDASNEAGTLVSVPINGEICPNTEITVTAWVADMTRASLVDNVESHIGQYPLAPNINVLFKGKNRDGEEKVLHRFTSGDALVDYTKETLNDDYYADKEKRQKAKRNANLMQWQQLYYTFVLADNLTYDEYYLEVQNNEPHTDGADYAIDDIRVFRTKPQISLVQAGDLCDTEINTVRFVTDYNRALHVLGLKAGQKVQEDQQVTLEELPKLLKDYLEENYKDKEGGVEEALQYFTSIYYAVYDNKDRTKPIQINYNNSKADKQNYRISFISTRLKDMEWTGTFTYNPDELNPLIASAPVILDGELKPGGDNYYLARLSTNELSSGDLSIQNNRCALVGDPFQLIVAGKMYEIVNGKSEAILPENAEINQDYTIIGKFWYKKDVNSEGFEELKDAKFDWFFGTLEEFVAPNAIVLSNGGSYSVQNALNTYNASNTDAAVRNGLKSALDAKYGIKTADNPGKSWRLILGATEFEHKMTQKYQPVVVQASADQDGLASLGSNVLYCSNPVQFDLGGIPPTIDPGDPDVPDPKDPDPEDPDPKDPTDPDKPEDPDKPQPDKFGTMHVRSVRVGLVQIQKMCEKNGTLRIPIHFRRSEANETFDLDENKNITVYNTSDKDRRNNLKDKTVAILKELRDEYVDMENGAKPQWDKHYFKIEFNADAISPTDGFREGFWYMIDIPYAVKDDNGKVVYKSSFKLTLKIVPEYVTWVGSADYMHNWNNDGPNHWRRSNDAELYTTNVANKNGIHDEAYTPMRFTKVTIYGKAKYVDHKYTVDGTAYSAYPHLYGLNKQSESPVLDMAVPAENEKDLIGVATKNIEYDLLADPEYEKELFGSNGNPDKTAGNYNYSCVRFYGNACDEIYIKPESEILHTEYLTYNTARIDYEMLPNRWYMLASPLKGVVSGDMYLPKENGAGRYARQETPAFEEINYNITEYTRWQPAVYMRGWDKERATVIRPGDAVNNSPNYAISANWSNLYNDVTIPFAPGTGFSIGTKVKTGFTDKILFRLPKADESYVYYKDDDSSIGGHETSVTDKRTGRGRFHISPDERGENIQENLITAYSESKGMLGNPFMSHLDMQIFFSKNNLASKTYYIMGESATNTTLIGDEYIISTDEQTDGRFVAPLQSFILKGATKNITFTTGMIAKAPAKGTVGLRSTSAVSSDESLPQLRITATRDCMRSTAVVAGLATASDSYVEGEDAVLLINEEIAVPQVYTLAGNQMTAINVTPEVSEIPVGVHGKDDTPVELSFKISGDMRNVTLVDKQNGKSYPVTDDLKLTVPGNTSGRYYLNGLIATSNEIVAKNRIICYNSAPGRIDISSVDPLSEVTVYDVAGRAIRTLRNLNMPTVSVDRLATGIYVVRAISGSQVVAEKLEVK